MLLKRVLMILKSSYLNYTFSKAVLHSMIHFLDIRTIIVSVDVGCSQDTHSHCRCDIFVNSIS